MASSWRCVLIRDIITPQEPEIGTYNHAVMFAQLDNHMIVMWKNSPTDEDQVCQNFQELPGLVIVIVFTPAARPTHPLHAKL